MTIDLIIAVLLIFLAFLGYLKGGLNQLFSLLAIILSVLFSPFFGRMLFIFITSKYELKIIYLSPLFTFVSGIIIYVAVKIIGIFLERLIIGDRTLLVKSNRLLGLCLGSLKACIIIVLCVISFGYISRFHPSLSKHFKEIQKKSFFVNVIDQVNPTRFLEIIPNLIKLKERIRYLPPKSNIYKEIMKDKRIKDLLSEDKLEKMVREKGLYSLLKDDLLKDLYKEKKVENILDKLNSSNKK